MNARPHFIYVSPVLPVPADQGSRQLMLESARLLLRLGSVTWVTRSLPGQEQGREALRREGFELALDRSFEQRAFGPRLLRRLSNDLRALWWRRPRELAYCCTPAIDRLVFEALERRPEAIGVSVFWHCWRPLRVLPRDRRVLILSDVEHLRLAESGSRSARARLQRMLLRAGEAEAMSESGLVLAISDEDRSAVAAIVGAREVATDLWPVALRIPASRSPRELPSEDGRPSLFVYGRWDAPFNRDGLEGWLRRDWPALRTAFPGCALRIAGAGLSGGLGRLAQESGAQVLGWVEDLDAEFAKSHAVLIPLRYAGGVRYRLLEAMAHGCACICTAVAARGSGAEANVHYLQADSPEEWVAAVRRCLEPAQAQRMREAARALVLERHSHDAAWSRARNVLRPMLEPQVGGR